MLATVNLWSDPLQFLTACGTLLAVLWGVRKTIADVAQTRANTRQTSNSVDRDVREEDREQATREVEASAALVASITAGWNVIAEQQQETIRQYDERHRETIAQYDARATKLEARIASLEAALDTREELHVKELEERDNKIREYRTKLHAANNELAKAGLVQHLVAAGILSDIDTTGIAPERRVQPGMSPTASS